MINLKILLSAVALLMFQFSYGQSRKIDELKENYLESSHLNFDGQKLPVVKWENVDTLKFHITGDLQYLSEKRWGRFLNDLETVTGLKLIETNDPEIAQIHIYFGELHDYFRDFNIDIPNNLSSNFDNWNNRRYNSQKQLVRTTFCIDPSKTRNNERGRYNLQKQFLKSLGLLGEVEDEYSIFYRHQTQGNLSLSHNDKRIVRIHYDPAIRAGMSYEEAERTLTENVDLSSILKTKY